MKTMVHLLIRFSCLITGFTLFLSIPRLFNIRTGSIDASFENFKEKLWDTLVQFFKNYPIETWLDKNITERYAYTMEVLILSLALITVQGLILAAITLIGPYKFRQFFKRVLDMVEAIPDLLVIFLFQIIVISIYKSTGLKLLQLYGFNAYPYFIPIVVTSFLPTLYLAQFLAKVLEEEVQKEYVIYAKAKGMSLFRIYVFHMLRNTLPLYIIQLRTIVWFVLSNIVLIEYMFKIKGFTIDLGRILFQPAPQVMFNFFLFAVPIILIDILIRYVAYKARGHEEVRL
ncbi:MULTISPECIES: ABC transporter permease subunit [Bacillaceae]|uniref:ABC transporter permease subunit n=1 Tax=Bacillaceae TaxID=186817 RepID=UPI00168186D6|nr:ABC transporter permease subunit [Bacillus sp. S3]